MGTPFDFFSPRSWPSDRSVSAEAQANRALLAQAMRPRGFRPMTRNGGTSRCAEPFPDAISISGAVTSTHKRKRPACAGRGFSGGDR